MSQSIPVSEHLRQALSDAAACAIAKYPAEFLRIERGLDLALQGHVALLADQHIAIVRSQTRPGVEYSVNGQCSCHDFSRAPGGKCKHRYAYWFMRRAHELLADTYYARIDTPATTLYGTARKQTDDTWRFRSEQGTEIVYDADSPALVLGGNIGIGAGQEREDLARWERFAQPQYADKSAAVAQYHARVAARKAQREAR
jgi:hypothetical protein